MPERTDQPAAQPTPVADDAHASAAELQARAADDYAQAQAAREQQTHRGHS